MSKWCFNYESGEYEYIERDGFSINSGEYVYNWDDSEYRKEEEEDDWQLVVISFDPNSNLSYTTLGVVRRNTVSVMHCQMGNIQVKTWTFLCGVLIIFIGF